MYHSSLQKTPIMVGVPLTKALDEAENRFFSPVFAPIPEKVCWRIYMGE